MVVMLVVFMHMFVCIVIDYTTAHRVMLKQAELW